MGIPLVACLVPSVRGIVTYTTAASNTTPFIHFSIVQGLKIKMDAGKGTSLSKWTSGKSVVGVISTENNGQLRLMTAACKKPRKSDELHSLEDSYY